MKIFITPCRTISRCILNVAQVSSKHLSEVNLPSRSSLSQLPDKQRLSDGRDDGYKRDNNCDKRMVICSRTFILIKGITGRQRYYLRRRFRAKTILRFHAVTRCISRQTTGGTKTPVQQSSPHKRTARKWHVLPPPALFQALAAILVPIACQGQRKGPSQRSSYVKTARDRGTLLEHSRFYSERIYT